MSPETQRSTPQASHLSFPDGLRALAALQVVLEHATLHVDWGADPPPLLLRAALWPMSFASLTSGPGCGTVYGNTAEVCRAIDIGGSEREATSQPSTRRCATTHASRTFPAQWTASVSSSFIGEGPQVKVGAPTQLRQALPAGFHPSRRSPAQGSR